MSSNSLFAFKYRKRVWKQRNTIYSFLLNKLCMLLILLFQYSLDDIVNLSLVSCHLKTQLSHIPLILWVSAWGNQIRILWDYQLDSSIIVLALVNHCCTMRSYLICPYFIQNTNTKEWYIMVSMGNMNYLINYPFDCTSFFMLAAILWMFLAYSNSITDLSLSRLENSSKTFLLSTECFLTTSPLS